MRESSSASPRALFRAQAVTLALLFVGYGGYYFCRADLSVALPLIIRDLEARGIDAGVAQVRLGVMVSLGVLAYAIGKLTLTSIADFRGGKSTFVGGMVGAIVCTLAFAAGGAMPVFTVAWIANRFVQSAGWAGLVKVASRWFDFSSYGSVMGVLSVSFLVGDALARQGMSALVGWGLGWRALFVFAAAVLGVICVLNILLLRESRVDAGFTEPAVNPINVFHDRPDDARPRTVADILRPMLRHPSFWVVCTVSFGTTLLRETFNTWTPTYFNQFVGLSEARAALSSSIFPAVGAASVLACGWISDRIGVTGRSLVMVVGLLIATLALFGLALVTRAAPSVVAVGLVGVVAVGLLGPYSYLAGAIAMDLGGRHGGATSSGIIDGVGYLGGVLAGVSIARISVSFGWERAFFVLALVCLGSALAASVLLMQQRRDLALR